MRAGQRVTCLASIDPGSPSFGDHGRVISTSGNYSHVMWTSGNMKDQIILMDDYDLAPLGKQSSLVEDDLQDSLDVGGLAITGVRECYEAEGALGLLNAMSEAGHLNSFPDIASEALSLIESRLRTDPGFHSVTATLDDDEGDSLIRAAAALILRDGISSEIG